MNHALGRAAALSATLLVGGALLVQPFTAAEAQTVVSSGSTLSASQAAEVAKTLGTSVDEAVALGYLTQGSTAGSFVLTKTGAAKVAAILNVGGSAVIGGLSAAQLSAIVVGAGVAGIIGGVASDDDDGPTGSATPTPAPSGSVSPTPTGSVSPTPTPTMDPGSGSTSNSASTSSSASNTAGGGSGT